jgi:hypothetical protein
VLRKNTRGVGNEKTVFGIMFYNTWPLQMFIMLILVLPNNIKGPNGA